MLQAELLLQGPCVFTLCCGLFKQGGLTQFASPELFQAFFKFAFPAYTWIAEICCVYQEYLLV